MRSPLSRLSAVCWKDMTARGIKGAAFDKSSLIEDAEEQRMKEPLDLTELSDSDGRLLEMTPGRSKGPDWHCRSFQGLGGFGALPDFFWPGPEEP